MASSSKNINMPLVFAIAIGSVVALIVSVMFGLAWYEYENRVVLQDNVIDSPTHDDIFDARMAEQRSHLQGIDEVIEHMAMEHAPAAPAEGETDPGHHPGHEAHDVH